MKATVKIAPVEHWCENMVMQLVRYPDYKWQNAIGKPVEIEIDSMFIDRNPRCGGRAWLLTDESNAEHALLVAGIVNPTVVVHICEHALEMD